MKIELLRQIGRFGIVGLAATLCHGLVFMIAMRLLDWHEQAGNAFAFIIAFFLSWGGHYFWTFHARSTGIDFSTLPRFMIIALSGYALNSFFVFVMITKLALPDFSVLPLMIGITPIIIFLLARYWAFKKSAMD